MRFLILLVLLICSACGFEHKTVPPAPATVVTQPSVCRIGPNDGPVLAERGIGGTGMPQFGSPLSVSAPAPASPTGQNRGIGGTGVPQIGVKPVVGNTGIVGAITGFASVCLDGVEVAYDPATRVSIDGQPGSPEALRAGQVAAVVAGPDADATDRLVATAISIRYEVSGPVSVADGNALTVAGQPVSRDANTRGVRQIAAGDWISVSGFRNHAGVIVATRIDPRTPGNVTIHGIIVKKSSGIWIGQLRLNIPPQSQPVHNGEAVIVTGTLSGSTLDAASVSPDLLYSDPHAYFGPTVKRLLIQSYVYTVGGPAYIAVGTSIYLAEGKLFYNPSGPSIFSLIVSPLGTLQAVGHILGTFGIHINPFAHSSATDKGGNP